MLFYLLIAIVAACELSPHIDTTNVIKKCGIWFVIIGSLIEGYGRHNDLPLIGIMIYFMANILSAYFTIRVRRKTDRGVA